MKKLNIYSANQPSTLINQNDEKRFGRFMFRPIQWIRQVGGYETLRIAAAYQKLIN